jgi:pyridoxine 5-phosphate synthase
MSIHKEIVGIARRVKPHQATLVPEKRQELTTEGGLDVAGNLDRIKGVVEGLKEKGIGVSLFIDPQENQLEASKKAGADAVELHTGRYADACLAGPPDPALPAGSWADRQAKDEVEAKKELEKLQKAVKAGLGLGLVVNAGHGLNYQNVSAVAHIQGIEELNIGHSIIARAVMVGLGRAVKEMKDLIKV